MRRRLTPLEQGRLWEAAWKRGRLRERQRHAGRSMRFHESAARQRAAQVARYVVRHRRDMIATVAFVEHYFGTHVGRRQPASSALAAFRESYRRPVA